MIDSPSQKKINRYLRKELRSVYKIYGAEPRDYFYSTIRIFQIHLEELERYLDNYYGYTDESPFND